MKDRWLAYAPILLLAGLAGLSYWLDQRVQPVQDGTASAGRDRPDFIVDEVHATRMDLSGHPRYVLHAKRMTHYRAGDTQAVLDAPTLTHFDENRVPLTIRANEGRLSSDGDHAYFIGDVVVKQPASHEREEMTMLTSFLHVIPDANLAKTDKAVTLIKGNSTVKSVGLEFNNETRTVKLLSNVRGTLETPAKAALPWDRRPPR
ncbi:MAG: LPS export ABC transporter periplasmic protein LptC [Burkholderiales bacterium]|nr:LPS export ABC transporter periplasmic protein LptC [Burkholderiales bacterium]